MDMFADNPFLKQAERQLAAFYGLDAGERGTLENVQLAVWARFTGNCLRIRNKYYEEPANWSPLQSCQYLMYLYLLARAVGPGILCDKIYNLSKIVSGADIYPAVELPEVFFFDHPVGTVLGRAKYGSHFMFAQGVTVGNNHGKYPEFGDCVCLNSGAKVLGSCRIGDNVVIAANAYVKDRDVPSDSVVFGQDRGLVIKTGCGERNREFFRRVFNDLA